MMNVDGSDYRLVTSYMNGEQVYAPRWSPSGDRILFDYSIKDARDLAWVKPDGSDLQFLITGSDDSRSGTFTRDGSKIVFSSDRTGIFNLYQYDIRSGAIGQLTNVLGGAFMPTIGPSGDIVYASYTSGGYKIVQMKNPTAIDDDDHHYAKSGNALSGQTSSLTALGSNGEKGEFNWNDLRSYDDTSLTPLSSRPYRNVFTSLGIVPFVRVDNYNTSNDALDVIKPGVYLFSQDVLDKLGMFASIALNKRLERDLYLQFAYRGRVPLFFQIGLEPVLTAELYNVTRKTDNFIELPEATIPVEVSYNLLEFDFVMTQPFLSQYSNIEFRFAHSRYTSIIEAFLNPYTNQIIPGSSDLYLIANDLSLKLSLNGVTPTRTSEINPVGRKIMLRIGRELNKFNGDGEYTVGSTGLIPVYKNINFTRAELRWREHIPSFIKDHTLTISFRGGSIVENSVDDFFDFYAGGLLGMRGYPFYAIGGNEMAVAGLEYRFPLINNIDIRVLHLYFDKLYASVFADIGNAWTGQAPTLRQFKTDIGAELRLESFSWYAYPTRIFLSAAYGFDQFEREVPSRQTSVTYGREWRLYLGVLFGFDFD